MKQFFSIPVLDNWMENNSSGGRGGRDSENWGGHGGRDSDKWGARSGNRDSEGWGGRGNRMAPWRGNANNRRRNDDWEGPNQKRWRRDDNPEWDEQQNPWKRGPMNEEEEWHNNKLGSQWAAGKKDEGNYSKFKNRDEERHRRPSKWGDKESDDKVKEDRWGNKKSVEQTSLIKSKDECNIEESSPQTSAPMDLDNYENESVDNVNQLLKVQVQETISNSNKDFSEHDEVRNDFQEKVQLHVNPSNCVAEAYDQSKENVTSNIDEQHNDKHQQLDECQNDFSNNSQGNIEKVQHLDNQCEFMQQNVEEKLHDEYSAPHDIYQDESCVNLNLQPEQETDQNNGKFVKQDEQLKSAVNVNDCGTSYENERLNYDRQSHCDEILHKSNGHDQQRSIDNYDCQTDETDKSKYAEGEESQGARGNFYFGADCESSINKSVELEQQNNEVFPTEKREITSDYEETTEINTTESNQS